MSTGGYGQYGPFAFAQHQSGPPLVVEDERTRQQLDPNSAPEKQAKTAVDAAIASGNVQSVQAVLDQVGAHIPQHRHVVMMRALRTASKRNSVEMVQYLLDQIRSCQPEEVFEFMKYALYGAAMQDNPAIMDFILGAVQKGFAAYPKQFLELLQHAVNACAREGNLGMMKFLMDHSLAASIPINWDEVFGWAVWEGKAEPLLQGAIRGGALYENIILMLLGCVKRLPENSDSRVGSRQSLKNTAKVELIKSYKKKDPVLFEKLMTAVKSFFPEESPTANDGDMAM